MSPKVSVCIACYNHENYIGKAIESVLNQTFQDFEILVCNNGSTDNSLQVIESFNDDRIKIESVYPNQQSTWAGNNCIERACGEYIALLCSDDLWEPEKLQKQIEYLDRNPECAAVFTRCQPVDQKGILIKSKKNPYYKQFNLLENRTAGKWLRYIWETANHSFCCSSACIRKTCLNEAGNFDIILKYIQDMNLWTKILTKHEVHILDDKLTRMRYFSSGSNLSARKLKSDFAVLNECYILYKNFANIDNIDKFLDFLPEAKERFSCLKTEFIPFYISILTLENNKKIHFKKSALNMLYDLMQRQEYRNLLKTDLNFTHMDLYNITEYFYYNFFFKTLFNRFGLIVRFFAEHIFNN